MRFQTLLLAGSCLALSAVAAGQGMAPKFTPWGVDLTAADAAVKPGDDFFAFVNGGWDKRTTIAEDRSFAGIDSVLNDQIEKDVRAIIEEQAAHPGAKGSIGQQVGDYYGSYMDEAAIEAKGITPLKADLARIAAIKDKKALAGVLGGNIRADVDALNSTDFYTDNVLGLWVSPSFDDTSKYAPFLLQGGLGMPDRQYYVGDRRPHCQTLIRRLAKPVR